MDTLKLLKEKRKRKGLTQREVASQLGISPSSLSHIESGRRKVPAKLGKRLEAMFGLSLSNITADDASKVKEAKLLVNESGGPRGGASIFRVSLPAKWVRDMGLCEDERNLTLAYDEEKKEITIKKYDKATLSI